MGFQPASNAVSYATGPSLVASAHFLNPSSLVLPRIMPITMTPNKKGYIVNLTPGPALDHVNTKRASAATYKRLNGKLSTSDYECELYGVEHQVPIDQSAQWDPLLRGSLLDMYGSEGSHKVRKDIEKQGADILFNTTTYNTGNGNGHAASNQWDVSAGKPHEDVATAKKNIRTKYDGVDDSDFFAVMDYELAIDAFQNLQERGNAYTVPGFIPASAPVSEMETLLARALGVGEVIIANAGYRSGGTDTAPTLTKYWNPFYCGVGLRPRMVTGEGSIALWRGIGATMTWSEMASGADGETPVPVSVTTYMEEQTDSEIIKVKTGIDLLTVNASAFYLITGCDA